LAILKGIHAAGILHCDLRRQNLLIEEHGEPAIIDFDQSKTKPSKNAMDREYAQLADILDGFEE
jgi:RIO-like serine/threonine protein kinase